MRILVVNHRDAANPRAGGLEQVVHQVGKRWVQWGHRVDVLCAGYPGAAREERVDGMRLLRGPGEYVFHWWAPWKIWRLGTNQYDVILECIGKVPCFLPLFERSTPIAVLIPHLFGKTIDEELPRIFSVLWRGCEKLIPLAYKRCRFWVISQSTAEDLRRRGIAADRIEVIYLSADQELFRPEPSVTQAQNPHIVSVGRLAPYKRVDLILRTVQRLRERFPTLRLSIVGRGRSESALQSLAVELHIADAMDFHGSVSDEEKKRLLLQSWVNVQTSSNEGWGLVVTEAGACGRPTVASDSPGLRESVRDGETGFLVPHGDVDALAGKLALLLSDAALRNAVGEAARAFAATFSWEKTAKESLRFLEDVVAREKQKRSPAVRG